ncbi:unnamed protein product, partial [Staurois parvus]
MTRDCRHTMAAGILDRLLHKMHRHFPPSRERRGSEIETGWGGEDGVERERRGGERESEE